MLTINHECRGDLIIRSEYLQICLVLYSERHRHPGHVTLDVLVRNRDEMLLRLNHNHLAFEVISLRVTAPARHKRKTTYSHKKAHKSQKNKKNSFCAFCAFLRLHLMGWSWAS